MQRDQSLTDTTVSKRGLGNLKAYLYNHRVKKSGNAS